MSKKKIGEKFILSYAIILLSISLILSYIEAILPFNSGYMGVKIGLANIVTLISLHILDIKWTLIINILRVLIMGLIFPNIIRFILSGAGFLVSFVVMCFFLKVLNFSIISTSIFGGVSHNITQILVLCLIFWDSKFIFISFIPIYTIFGILSGLVVGIISDLLYKKICKLHLNK